VESNQGRIGLMKCIECKLAVFNGEGAPDFCSITAHACNGGTPGSCPVNTGKIDYDKEPSWVEVYEAGLKEDVR